MKTAVLALALSAALCPAQNLLFNGDLELPAGGGLNDIDGWTLSEPSLDDLNNPVDSAQVQGFANHTPGGERGLWLRPFAGGLDDDAPDSVDAILTQAVAGNAGTSYTLSAWFLYEQGYSGLDAAAPTRTVLAIDFLDAGMSLIGSAELDVDAVQAGDSTWRQFQVIALAPGGTVFVQARAAMYEGVFSMLNPQSAFVDDLVLTPSPASIAPLPLVAGLATRRRRRV